MWCHKRQVTFIGARFTRPRTDIQSRFKRKNLPFVYLKDDKVYIVRKAVLIVY